MDNEVHGRTRLCKCCGNPIDLDQYVAAMQIPQKMDRDSLCYECAFWMLKAEKPPKNREIIDGWHYIINPYIITYKFFQGSGGRTVFIVKYDLTVKRSNDVLCQGKIPDKFLSIFPNTATFVERPIYTKVKNNKGFRCGRIGCFDRYHCIWYDPKLKEPNGPWNKIPANWKIGGEGCELFINNNIIKL